MDVEKKIELILDQQARFFAGLEELRERQNKTDELLSKFAEQQGQINLALGKAMLGLTDRIDQLLVAQAALTASQAATDERLNALIGIVDGWKRQPPPA